MKTLRFLILILVTMLVACGSAAAPEEPGVASPEPPTPTVQPPQATETTPPTPSPEPAVPGDESAETGGRQAVFPNTIVVYQRDSQKWTIYVTGRVVDGDGNEWMVPAEQVQPLFDSVEADSFWELEEAYGEAGDCPNCPVQKLTVYRGGEIKEITVSQELATLPKALGMALTTIDRAIVSH
jgi:hypothetical protein